MTPKLIDSVCASYERDIERLTTELQESRKLLLAAEETIDVLRELARRQSERLEAVREKATAVRDGCLEWERGAMQRFYIEE